jgi:hypothetical protein
MTSSTGDKTMIPTTTDETGKPRATVVWFDPSRRPGLSPQPAGRGDVLANARVQHVATLLTELDEKQLAAVLAMVLAYLE